MEFQRASHHEEYNSHASKPFISKKNQAKEDLNKPFFRPKDQLNVGGFFEDHFIGGFRTKGEFIQDSIRPVNKDFENYAAAKNELADGINVGYSTNSPPYFGSRGKFLWDVGFQTSGRLGWLVQEINLDYRIQNPDPGVRKLTPKYFEAWEVDSKGDVTPGAGGLNDNWGMPFFGAKSSGHWSVVGRVHFTKIDPKTKGFVKGTVPEAGVLLSTMNKPADYDLGPIRLSRYAQATWDKTGKQEPLTSAG